MKKITLLSIATLILFEASGQSSIQCPGSGWFNNADKIAFRDYITIPVGAYFASLKWSRSGNPVKYRPNVGGSQGSELINVFYANGTLDSELPGVGIPAGSSGLVIPFTTGGADQFPTPNGLQASGTLNFTMNLTSQSTGASYTIIGRNITGVWQFNSCTVPLKLTSFTAQKNNECSITISWTIEEASNMSHYILERAGGNGTQFTRITSGAIVNTPNQQNYGFTDNYPLNGNNFYRLKMVDNDGAASYSEVRLINSACTNPQPSPLNCSSIVLNGPTSICDYNVYQFSVSGLPDYCSVNWSVNPTSGTIVSIQQTDYDRVTVGKVGEGQVTLTATPTRCTNSLYRTMQVGTIPSGTYSRNGISYTLNLNNGVSAGSYRVDLQCNSCTGVQWTRTSGTAYYYTAGPTLFFDLYSGSVSFRVTGTNACGTFDRTYSFYKVGGGYVASPNPSKGLVDLTATGDGALIYEAKVVDNLGRLHYSKRFPGGVQRAQLNLAHLRRDIYLLQINSGKHVTVQQLILEK